MGERLDSFLKRNQWPIRIGLLIILALSLISLLALRQTRIIQPADSQLSLVETDKTVSTRFMSFGDIMWGRYIEVLANRSQLGYQHPFSKLDGFKKTDYDFWLTNIECPVTDGVLPYQTQVDSVIFNCRPEFLDEFGKWFEVASIGNNHTGNMDGQIGLDETRQHLVDANIQFFGHYDPAQSQDSCEIIALPSDQDFNLPVAFCAFNGVYREISAQELAVISDYTEFFPTIVMPHAGTEYIALAEDSKVQLYRQMIDLGADLIIGGHPHEVQNTEVYNGKLIVYSLGNFIFDQYFSDAVMQGMGLDTTISVDLDRQWQDFIASTDCAQFKDDCLTLADQNNLSKPHIDWQFDIVGAQISNYLTQPANELNLTQITERANWQATSVELHN